MTKQPSHTKEQSAPGAGQGTRGNENRTSIYEGTSSLNSVQNTPDTATALDEWRALSIIPKTIEADTISADTRPDWAADALFTGTTAQSATWVSVPTTLALRRHSGEMGAGRVSIKPAAAYLDIRENVHTHDRYIHLERWGSTGGKRARVEGSGYMLTLDEAKGLAAQLLLAVTVAEASEFVTTDETVED